MKKMVFLLALTVLFASVNVYGVTEDERAVVGLNAEPIVGRTIEVITADEPESIQWKCSDSENGTYSSIAGATGKALFVGLDLLGKWIKVEADGIESEPYKENSTTSLLTGEDFEEGYTGNVQADESGNKYFDYTGTGTELEFDFETQAEGRVVVELRYKYEGNAANSFILTPLSAAGKQGMQVFCYNSSLKTEGYTFGSFAGGTDFQPESGSNNDGEWHTMQIIVNLGTKGVDLYLDGQRKVTPGSTKLETKYFADDIAAVKCTFFRPFSIDDLKVYKINDNNEAPYVEGMMRLLGSNAEIKAEYNNIIVKDYDNDGIAWTTYEWFYSDAEDGEYTRVEGNNTNILSYQEGYQYIKCDVSVCDNLGAVTTVTMGPSKRVIGKQMPYRNQPTLSGGNMIGDTLRRTLGGQAGEYGQTDRGTKWYRAETASGPWTTEIGAGDTYTLTAADAGHYITCCVQLDSQIDGGETVRLTRMAQPVFCPDIQLLQHIPEGETANAKAVAKIKKQTGESLSFKIINAYYQQETLVDVEVFSYSLPAGSGYAKIAAPITKMDEGYAVKSFIFKDFDSLMPLGNSVGNIK